MNSRYKDLVAFQQTIALADAMYETVATWPELARRTVGEQVLRSADSVGANIAEASGGWTEPERRRFLIIARRSLYETEYWIDRAKARRLPLPTASDHLDDIARPLSGLIKRHT